MNESISVCVQHCMKLPPYTNRSSAFSVVGAKKQKREDKVGFNNKMIIILNKLYCIHVTETMPHSYIKSVCSAFSVAGAKKQNREDE